jgi:hypothetical protein
LDRIEIPTDVKIPDPKAVSKDSTSSWTIPHTEITIALVKDASPIPRFLFTGVTVRKAESYYEVVENLPYRPDSGHGALLEQLKTSGNLVLSKEFVDRLPSRAKIQISGETAWQ